MSLPLPDERQLRPPIPIRPGLIGEPPPLGQPPMGAGVPPMPPPDPALTAPMAPAPDPFAQPTPPMLDEPVDPIEAGGGRAGRGRGLRVGRGGRGACPRAGAGATAGTTGRLPCRVRATRVRPAPGRLRTAASRVRAARHRPCAGRVRRAALGSLRAGNPRVHFAIAAAGEAPGTVSFHVAGDLDGSGVYDKAADEQARTVPLTTALVGHIYGMRYASTLTGIVFFGHQIGSFVGVWLGGKLYVATGSYDAVWWISVALGLVAAALCMPVRERALVPA